MSVSDRTLHRGVAWLVSALVFLHAGCATRPDMERPRERALPFLFAANGKLGWAGLTLAMPRSVAEQALGRRLAVRHDPYVDVCGEYYSVAELHGRRIRIDWSAATPDGVIDVISVPYGAAERLSYDDDLSMAAVTAVPELVAPVAEESGDCPPRFPPFLVLRSDPEQAINLKPSGEGVFFLTTAGCVD